ncbi:MAG: transposase [Gammaproteobacteria bacterium]|nr:transposase [Gammaproteobacteria bacterium]
MKNTILLLPGFHLSTLRRKPRSPSQQLATKLRRIREKSICQLDECFGQFIPSQDIAELYIQRWDVELFLRDLKTTMGMDILRCKTPAMVEKEILMHLIVYNCIRLLMNQAAEQQHSEQRDISFKASVQAFRQWQPLFNDARLKSKERRQLMALLINAIAAKSLYQRPGRREPRCVKRRPKPYVLLTAPRHLMKEIPHRGRYRAERA